MTVDFWRIFGDHFPLHINNTAVERVKSIYWRTSSGPPTPSKESPVASSFTMEDEKRKPLPPILTAFCSGDPSDQLSHCLVWELHCLIPQDPTVSLILKTAENIITVCLPTITTSYHKLCIFKSTTIVNVPSCHSHGLFTLLPSMPQPLPIQLILKHLLSWGSLCCLPTPTCANQNPSQHPTSLHAYTL